MFKGFFYILIGLFLMFIGFGGCFFSCLTCSDGYHGTGRHYYRSRSFFFFGSPFRGVTSRSYRSSYSSSRSSGFFGGFGK